ncbi:MAG: RNA 3'-terminal phosphate cyclase [Planctomycetes bacterium]|nr:RNA 3'-terminal phosphate cyclase [Planctomycetota bacterium]
MADHLLIDGSFGEGGGQIIRSSLALSLITGRPITIENIRARRSPPGLRRQHLTAVLAAAEVGRAAVEGAEVGASRLTFEPGEVRPGEYDFRIGTAGSTTLVLQTVLPALLQLGGPSVVRLEGGTHNPFAPPFEFLQRTYLPLVSRLGPSIRAELHRHGFYPAGGGRFTVYVQPASEFGRLDLLERGRLQDRRIRGLIANLPRHIAERECHTIAERSGWGEKCCSIEEVEADGPGNAVLIEMEHEHVTEVVVGFGQKGVRAETVASRAWREARTYLDAGVPVGEHLADQLLLPLGLAAWRGEGGGSYLTGPLTEHARTHIEVLKTFLDVPIRVEDRGAQSAVHVGREA